MPTLDEEKEQPTTFAIKTACVLFPGPVFTFRAFKQSAPRSLRAIAEAEFREAITILENSGFGKVCSLRIPRTANPVTVFVKKDPDSITWPYNHALHTSGVPPKIPFAATSRYYPCHLNTVRIKRLCTIGFLHWLMVFLTIDKNFNYLSLQSNFLVPFWLTVFLPINKNLISYLFNPMFAFHYLLFSL